MSGPIPQLVDISHALQSGIVQQIRSDVIQYSQLPQLSEEQVKRIDAYLQAINSALTHFTIDNQHIERVDDGVTDLDIQLYNGLRSMYTDYMTQLTALKLTKSPYAYQQQQQGPIQLQVQLPNQQQQQIPIIQNPGLASQAVNAINDQFQFHPQSQYQYQYQPQPQPQPQQPASAIQGVPMMVQPEGYNPIQQQQQQQQPMLSQPQQEFQAQTQAEQQTQGIADEDTAKKTLQERKEQRAREEERRINENIKILEYIHGELPYKKPSERRKYIDTLAENETKVPLIIKSEEFLDSMSKLCALDIDNAENIRSYIRLLKMLGYSKSKLRASLPQSLTAPSPSPSSSNAVSTATSSNVPGDNTANIVSSTSSVSSSSKTKAKTTKVKRSKTKTESKTDKTTASKSRVKQRDIPPIEVYIADKKDKDTARVSSPSSSSSSSVAETASSAVSAESVSSVAGVDEGTIPVGTQGENNNNNTTTTTNNNNNENGNTKVDKSPDDGKLQEKASEAQNRKKISFSNYLKKEDSKDHTAGTKRSLEPDKTSTTGTPDDGTIRKKVKSTTEPYSTSSSSTSSGLKSILKNSPDSNTGTEVSSRKNKAIRFQDDSDLVRVYGDGLPSEGLKVLPKELKKLLRPFKAGVPNEKLLLGDFIQKPRPLHLDIDVQNSDISETKGGPVPCDTKTPPYYRENFRNFNKKLTSPPSERLMDATFQDPALLQEELGRSPIIAGAFGRNRLLLRSDRGGIPYRNVPVVTRNKYPPRYTRPSRAV